MGWSARVCHHRASTHPALSDGVSRDDLRAHHGNGGKHRGTTGVPGSSGRAVGVRSGPASESVMGAVLADTPNYRGLGRALSGRDEFRWHFGPMFYRGNLADGNAKVLVIVYGAFTRFAHAARSYSCKRPPRRSRRFSAIGCVPFHVAADGRPFGGAKSRLR
jgi:hypothetical protein